MLPLKDENPTENTAWVTGLFIGANVAVWLLLQGAVAGGTGGGVAFWAHVGGFVAGLVAVFLFGGRSGEGR